MFDHTLTTEERAAVGREVRGFLARCLHPENRALRGLAPLALALAILQEMHSQLIERGLLDANPGEKKAA